MTDTDAPRCAASGCGAVATRAITCPRCPDFPVCDRHALPGDLPLAGAVAQVRRAQFPEVGQPQGIDDER